MAGSGSSDGGDESDEGGVLAAASAEERLSKKPFGACTIEELQQLYRLMGAFKLNPPRALLGRKMERLSRLAHRIVWVNPRKQRSDYQPLVGRMAAALPWVDEFVSGHSLDALEEVVRAVAGRRTS
jgi:VWA domain containing CoxE-like protein